MSYMHIDNLYKSQEILLFKQCYALEKIHGTSAHIAWKQGKVNFSSGGENHDRFMTLFDQEALTAKFTEKFGLEEVTIFGEAYGGKQQGMRKTYGENLKFVAFEVKIGDRWLSVPHAEGITIGMGLEFVPYSLISTTIEAIDAERDKPSVQAVRNGITEEKLREGIVLRPLIEVTLNNDKRIIAKHKRAEFAERGGTVELDPTKREVLEKADSIALEWVTPMRLEHVIDTMISTRDNKELELKDIPILVPMMWEDVCREASGEIKESNPARKAVGARTVKLYKERLEKVFEGVCSSGQDAGLQNHATEVRVLPPPPDTE